MKVKFQFRRPKQQCTVDVASARPKRQCATDAASKKQTVGKKNVESSADRVRKFREKVKQSEELSLKYKEKKKIENQKYRAEVKGRRQTNASFNVSYKKNQKLRQRKCRAKKKASVMNEVTEEINDSPGEEMKSTEDNSGTRRITRKRKRSSDDGSSIRKRASRARKGLPGESKKWATTVHHLIQTATPKRKSMLSRLEDSMKNKDRVTSTEDHLEAVIDELGLATPGRPKKEFSKVKRKLMSMSVEKKSQSGLKAKSRRRYLKRKEQQQKAESKVKVAHQAWKPKITDSLEENSRVMPNKRDTIMVEGKLQAKRHLLIPKYQLYQKFKAKHPSYKYKFTTFLKQIPKNYTQLKMSNRRVCVCSKDYNLEQKVEALNYFCQKSGLSFKTTVRELSNESLCKFTQFPRLGCVTRKCTECGTQKIIDKYDGLMSSQSTSAENNSDEHVAKWYEWRIEEDSYTNSKGQKKTGKVWKQVPVKATATELIKMTADSMKEHSFHLFRSDVQYFMRKNLTDVRLPLDHAVAIMDFSENINIMPQDEIEASHWTQKQVTLHPVYVVRHSSDSTADDPKLIKESLIMISDDMQHDAGAVLAFTRELLVHIRQNPGPSEIKALHRWTDNCAVQYKCRKAFGHLPIYEDIYGVKVVYHFSESGHGKGPSDGLGAVTKQKLDRLIIGEQAVVNNAYQVYLALCKELTEVGDNRPSRKRQLETSSRRFLYIPLKKIRKITKNHEPQYETKTIRGTHDLHMITTVPGGKRGILQYQDLSCTCKICLKQEIGPCFYGQLFRDPTLVDITTGKPPPTVQDSVASTACTASSDDPNSEDHGRTPVAAASVETSGVGSPSLPRDLDTDDGSGSMLTPSQPNDDATQILGHFTCENLETEQYYAVFYTHPYTYYVGRVLKICDCENIAKTHVKMIFLEAVYLASPATYNWPRARHSLKPECVDPHYIFRGPLKLNGAGPFEICEFDNIQKLFQMLKKRV